MQELSAISNQLSARKNSGKADRELIAEG